MGLADQAQRRILSGDGIKRARVIVYSVKLRLSCGGKCQSQSGKNGGNGFFHRINLTLRFGEKIAGAVAETRAQTSKAEPKGSRMSTDT